MKKEKREAMLLWGGRWGVFFCVLVFAASASAAKPRRWNETRSANAARDLLKSAAMAMYNHRAQAHYTRDWSLRWYGINHNVHPPNAPKYSDCSSAATWVYWTVFGRGKDFLNNEGWKAGNTDSMIKHGRTVPLSQLRIGDLVFYGHPVGHVAIFVGNGMVISHGGDPVCHCSLHYRKDLNHARTYF